MPRLRSGLMTIATGTLALASIFSASAQSTPDAAEPGPRAQLAAMTLSVDQLPTGYTFAGETFRTADEVVAGGVDEAALTDAGFVTQYVSVYENLDTSSRIRSYVTLWNDADGAKAGFELLEDEAVSGGDGFADEALDVGQEPRELTTGTYTDVDGAAVAIEDATFTHETVVAGVAVENLSGEAVQAGTAADLAATLDGRIASVMQGDSPESTDLTLPGKAISFAEQGVAWQAGFLSSGEVEALYGSQGSLLGSLQATWVDANAFGDGPARIAVGVSQFADAADAASAVDQSADLAPAFPNQVRDENFVLDGVDTFAGYRYSSSADAGDTLDSYRVIFAQDGMLTVIDVQGSASDAMAFEIADAAVKAQLACQTDGQCEAPELPAEFTGDDTGA